MKKNSSKQVLASVVVIGASAGGLKALRTFFSTYKLLDQSALIIIQHLDASGKNLAAEVLELTSHSTVTIIDKDTKLLPGKIYLVPPQSFCSFGPGTVSAHSLQGNTERFSIIDKSLFSLAEAYGTSAVGVILSGEGNDGTEGIKAINEKCGLTIAQTPESCEHLSMPQSAILNAKVDYILSPEEIAPELLAFENYLVKLESNDDQGKNFREIGSALGEICDRLNKSTGHDFKHYKTSTLVRRIARRLQVLHLQSIHEYLERLGSDEDEIQLLFRELLINVTGFFRDREAFRFLKSDILPAILERKDPDEKTRIWVAGCSTGEEVYSFAIILREIMQETNVIFPVQILATDIDEDALKIARKGVYATGIENHVSKERLEKYFTRRGGKYYVTRELRELCLFSSHNLLSDPPFTKLDLISCRNVLIYMGSHLQKKMFPIFHYALAQNGYLFLGTSESFTSHKELFRVVSSKHRLGQRKNMALQQANFLAQSFTTSTRDDKKEFFEETRGDIHQICQRIILDEFAPKYVVITEEGTIHSLSAGFEEFMAPSEGTFQPSIHKLIRPELRLVMRSLIKDVVKHKRRIDQESASIKMPTGTYRIGITGQPIPKLGEEEPLYMLVFRKYEFHKKRSSDDSPNLNEKDLKLIEHLEQELTVTREELDKTVQDLEASNEELKSSNEELLSMNEELQSSNEEMETSKEEIQSVNEALQNSLSDLENLFSSTQIATLFLSRDLKIRNFTPTLSEIYPIKKSDIGRDIRDLTCFATTTPEYPETPHDPITMEIELRNGKRFLQRVLPYLTQNNQVDGIVSTFLDVTESRETELRLQRKSRELELTLKAGNLGTFYWNLLNNEASWDEVAYKHFGFETKRPPVTYDLFLSLIHPEDKEMVQRSIQEAISSQSLFNCEFRIISESGEVKWLLERGHIFSADDGSPSYMMGIIQDITKKKIEQIDYERNVDSSPAILWITEKDGRRSYLSKQWFEITGQTPESGLGMGWLNAVHPDDAPRISKIFLEANQKQGPFKLDYRILQKDGSYRWAIDAGNPRFSADGEFLGYAGTVIDVHDRNETFELLREEQAKLKALFETSGSAMTLLRGKDFIFESANPEYLRMVSHRDIIGKSFVEAIPEIIDSGLPEIMTEVFETGKTYTGTELLVPLRKFTGGPFEDWYFDFSYIRIDRANGEPYGIFIHAIDVTEKVLSRRRIEESERNLKLALKSGKMGSWHYNLKTGAASTSHEITSLIGEKVDGEIESVIDKYIHPEDKDVVREKLSKAIQEKTFYFAEYRLVKPDGEILWLSSRGDKVMEGDEIVAYTGISQDITERKLSEIAIQESQRRYECASKATRNAIWDWNLVTNEVLWTEALHTELGYPRELMSSDATWWYDHIHPEDREDTVHSIHEVIDSGDGTHWTHEYRFKLASGEYMQVFDRGFIIRDESGKAIRMIGAMEDVSKLRENERALKEAEERYKSIFEATQDAFFIFNPEGVLIETNPSACRMHGYDYNEMIGMTGKDFVHPEDLTEFSRFVEDVKLGKMFTVTARHLRKDGSTIYIEVLGTKFTYKHSPALLAVVRDITEKKTIQDALEAQHAITKTITDNAASCLFMMDKKGHPTFMNPAAMEVTGYKSIEEIFDRPLHYAVHWKKPDGSHYPMEECPIDNAQAELKQASNQEEIFCRKDGSLFPVSYSIMPLEENGEVVGSVLEFRDISREKEILQELKSAVSARDEFLSIASHELKTPLTSLLMQIQLQKRLLDRDNPDAWNKEKVKNMNEFFTRLFKRLNRLIEDMLDISRIRTGKLDIKTEPTEIFKLCEDIITHISEEYQNAGATVPEISGTKIELEADTMRIEQVLTNLLTNALRYGNKKPVKVSVEKLKHVARVTVEDHGLGISLENQKKIFNRFERAISATEISGLGLGLFISEQIIGAHGGKIWVESELGQGSKFIFELPLKVQ